MFKKKIKLSIMAICAIIMLSFVITGSIGKQLSEIDGHPMLTAKHVFFFNLK